MIKRLPAVFLLLYFFIGSINSLAEEKFSGTPDLFVGEMEQLFKVATDKKAAKAFIEILQAFWLHPETSPELKELMIKTCQRMAVKKARPYPDYHTYLTTIMAFHEKEHMDQSFDNWHKAVTDLLHKPRFALRHVKSFLTVSKNLVLNNAVYTTPAVVWHSTSRDYHYEYNEKKLSIVFGPTNLVCHSKKDSIVIHDTEGVFYPLEKMWHGEKGRITWERSGFDAEMVKASFGEYSVRMDKAAFAVDSVEFFNRHYFDYPLHGSMQHKVMRVTSPEKAIYPKFVTTGQRFKIEKIHQSIDYEGGFAQNGAKFLGAGTQEKPAQITIYRNDTAFISAKAMYFGLRKDQILSNNTEVTIALDRQHIYHPGLIFKYMADLEEVHLIRNSEGIASSPYFNTFHNVSMDVELIRWKIGSQFVDLRMLTGAAQNQSFFESLSYFREEFYNRLQGMDAIHPLQGLKNCSKFYKDKPFTVTQYAKYMGFPESPIRQQIIQLSFHGFVGYNVNTDEITVRQRLKDYLLFRIGKKDYDVITFRSITGSEVSNARIDLANYDLDLNGVESISICDHQNVVFFPRNEKIILKENRNFVFNGTINAGMLTLAGDGFKFLYDDFRIDMSNIDSLKMKVQSGELDYFGQPVLKDVENTIAQLSGYLQIDEKDNKSGARSNPQFPILKSDVDSYVYFDNKNIQGGAYHKDQMYYTLDPFEMDSINTLTRNNFNFSGEFESGIFPTFREQLTIRPDYSLGFKRETPENGYPIYDGKATFTSTIDLSNAGLKGNGELDYLTTTSFSEDFTFLPDMVKGQAYDFTVAKQKEGVEYADAKSKYIYLEYMPQKEELWAHSQEENFTMYNKEAELQGKMKVTPYGMTGAGTFFMRRANVKSKDMDFGHHTVLADSSDFNLTGDQVEGVNFSTTNLISDINFEERQGTFRSRSGGSKVDFSDNKYISYISEFSWDMDKNNIFLGARGSKGNRFVSTHRRQDSLAFFVPMATYDVDTKTIYAEEVKNIESGDANLILKNGLVTIREDALLDPLDSVKIVLDKDSLARHTLYDAHVNVKGRFEYDGYGMYDYINGDGKTLPLTMNNIKYDEDEEQTVAKGKITDSDLFTFNKHFAYKGDVDLTSKQQLLSFNGGVQLLHRCSGDGPQTYVRIESQIDPKDVRIPIGEEVQDFEFKPIYKNFFITKDSTHVYSSFLEGRKDYSDVPMIDAQGLLVYNDKDKSFDITTAAKIADPDTTGNLLRFSESACNIQGYGDYDFGIDLDQVKTRASGHLIDDKGKINASAMMGIEFFLNDATIDALYATIIRSTAKDSKVSAETFIERLAEWTGRKTAQKVEPKRTGTGEGNLPADVHQTLLFSNIDWQWDSGKKAFICDGKADLAYIKQFIMNKEVTVKAEIVRKRSGNMLDIYMSFDENTWVYFSYKSKYVMYTLSSNPEYNSLVQGLKEEERKPKSGGGSYKFILSPQSKMKNFLKKFKGKAPADTTPKETEATPPAEEEKKE